MKIIYAPEDRAPQHFDFDIDKLGNLETEALEELGGDTWSDFGVWWEKLLVGNIRARRGLLWLLLRRSNPKLTFDEISFRLGDLEIEDDEPAPVGKDELGDSATDSPSPQPDSEP